MYNAHFGLQQAPFRITPDTRLFFSGGGRGDILDALVYAITSGEGIIKVVGEVGSGKTMLCRMLEERLPENIEIVYLANPSLSPEHILQAIALEMILDVPENANRLQVMHALQQRLLEKHAKNRQVVVFVEEAQSMPIETLEEIRLLSNLETQREKLLQIVLFGQPELDEKLDLANIRQLRERITHSFHLQPLSGSDLRDYVRFRMRAVGYRGPDVFRPAAYSRLVRGSEGLTRRINILADKSLLAAFAEDRHDVKRKDVNKAIVDSQFERRRPGLAPKFILALGVIMAVGAAAWTVLERSPRPEYVLVSPVGSRAAETRSPSEVEQAAPVQADVKTALPARTGTASLPVALSQAGPREDPATDAEIPAESTQAGSADENGPVRTPGPESFASAAPGQRPRTMVAEAGPATRQTPDNMTRSLAGSEAKMAPAAHASRDAPSASEPPAPRGLALVSGHQAEEPRRPVAQVPSASANARADPGSLLDQRMEITRRWLRNTSEEHYSIQLILTARSQRPRLEALLETQADGDGLQHVYVYETVIDNRPYIGVLYGEFPTLTAAREALENLPAALKRFGPFIRNVKDVSTVG